jgi:hypothetical protein
VFAEFIPNSRKNQNSTEQNQDKNYGNKQSGAHLKVCGRSVKKFENEAPSANFQTPEKHQAF